MLTYRLLIIVLSLGPRASLADNYDRDPGLPKPIFEIQNWPQDIVSVPCAAWRKDEIGGWSLTGTLNWTNGDVQVTRPSYQPDSAEGVIIENKCKRR